ncbi:D-tyrosyl-tRNA(Tyr) deacylase [Tepidanaerobacter acetatoxydans Re1]|uniref:D-aminoacyl-tRNA deacylase n=1 Tax=Tepidanaerobacter acetatoxydans (strain DSM 21804 / JCM 16047 / Re1) TaxID=1209989 RepID=F4LVJ9_TEPAE|nr:D-aminoacyl-tRNA deacylase [Tepidanaerobacter acetatoxydans]AEE91585.1 D-tyrosyl-tRNA(Tyr) deacylase [Tepidanaerobacter acetatoxydans Re1]CCP26309.1 D-tyrosyl-tRNA(Tyr) deacylase [Tepidanaerobacter acetatoxydans Re1]
MRAVVQRVKKASVSVQGKDISKIDNGIVVFLGVAEGDTMEDVDYLAEKIVGLRIFEDEEGKMNKSVQDIDAAILIVSQFTLLGDVRKGRRPSFSKAAHPKEAQKLYKALIEACKKKVKAVEEGQFQAEMLVNVLNDGPVTILIDSDKQF